MKTQSVLIACAILLAGVALFPPVDRVIRGGVTYALNTGAPHNRPDRRLNEGFVFLGNMDGAQQIRMPQWLAQMAAVAAIGGMLALAARRSK